MSEHDPTGSDPARLFREQVGRVRPLRQDRVEPVRKRLAPQPRKTREDEHRVLEEMLQPPQSTEIETGDELTYARPGLQHKVLRRLRRGQFSIQGELDLHGMTEAAARDALAHFVHRCRDNGWRCARIVHGKGRGSPQRRPVLKSLVNRWLPRRREVLAFCSALPADGGTGAVYVLLRSR